MRGSTRATAAVLAVLTAGCYSGRVPLSSPRDEPFYKANPKLLRAESCGFMLAGVIPILVASSLKRASKQLFASGYHVENVRATTDWTYALVGTLHCVTLVADGYRIKKPGD